MTRKRTGSMSMVRSALISSYTVIEPSSAAIAEPARPARTAAAKSEAASPSTRRRSRMPAPRRPTGPGRRGTRPTASTAMVVAPFEMPGADQPVPLARDEPPGHVPCAGAIRLGVPAVESVERRPQGEHPAVLRQHAVEERRHLSGRPPVNLDAPAHGEERREALAVPGGLVRLPLPPPQDQHGGGALVVEVLHVLAPVNGPEPEAGPGRSADGRDEREGEEAALEPRLGEPEVRGEQDHADALEAVEVGHVEVEGQDAEVGPERGAGAVEDEGEELEAGRPCGRAGLRLGRRAVAVREEEEAEGLVVVLPAGRNEREEDVGLVVALPAALLAEPEQQTNTRVSTAAADRPNRQPVRMRERHMLASVPATQEVLGRAPSG